MERLSKTLQYEVNNSGTETEEINLYNNNGTLICTLVTFGDEYSDEYNDTITEESIIDEVIVLPSNKDEYSMLFEAVNEGLSYSPSVSFRVGRSSHRIVLSEDGSKRSVFKTYEYRD